MTHLPWDSSYTPPKVDEDLLKEITGAVESAVNTATEVATSVGSEVAGQVAGEAASHAIQETGKSVQDLSSLAEGELNAVTSTLPPSGAHEKGGLIPSFQTHVSHDEQGQVAEVDWISQLEANAKSAAEAAYAQALPAIQGRIVEATTKVLAAELEKALGTPQVAQLPTGKEATKLDAWERAGRTFLVGLGTTILFALITVIGQAASSGTTNFFTVDGWKSVAVLAGGSVMTSVLAYLYRYLKEPAGAAIDSSTKKG